MGNARLTFSEDPDIRIWPLLGQLVIVFRISDSDAHTFSNERRSTVLEAVVRVERSCCTGLPLEVLAFAASVGKGPLQAGWERPLGHKVYIFWHDCLYEEASLFASRT